MNGGWTIKWRRRLHNAPACVVEWGRLAVAVAAATAPAQVDKGNKRSAATGRRQPAPERSFQALWL